MWGLGFQNDSPIFLSTALLLLFLFVLQHAGVDPRVPHILYCRLKMRKIGMTGFVRDGFPKHLFKG